MFRSRPCDCRSRRDLLWCWPFKVGRKASERDRKRWSYVVVLMQKPEPASKVDKVSRALCLNRLTSLVWNDGWEMAIFWLTGSWWDVASRGSIIGIRKTDVPFSISWGDIWGSFNGDELAELRLVIAESLTKPPFFSPESPNIRNGRTLSFSGTLIFVWICMNTDILRQRSFLRKFLGSTQQIRVRSETSWDFADFRILSPRLDVWACSGVSWVQVRSLSASTWRNMGAVWGWTVVNKIL